MVDNAGDIVDETAVGNDLIQASFTLTCRSARACREPDTDGYRAINGTGNGLANAITGNSGANIIEGKGGADTLDGGAGLDTVSYASSAAV